MVLIMEIIKTQNIYTRKYLNSLEFHVRKQKLTARRLRFFLKGLTRPSSTSPLSLPSSLSSTPSLSLSSSLSSSSLSSLSSLLSWLLSASPSTSLSMSQHLHCHRHGYRHCHPWRSVFPTRPLS